MSQITPQVWARHQVLTHLHTRRGGVGGRRPELTGDQAVLAQRLYDEREKTVQQIATCLACRGRRRTGHLDWTIGRCKDRITADLVEKVVDDLGFFPKDADAAEVGRRVRGLLEAPEEETEAGEKGDDVPDSSSLGTASPNGESSSATARLTRSQWGGPAQPRP
ncbi:hypothetical protein OG426_17445 [Streptomyces canus]|uniref:hypothetical protein n=1 Tax=Streptomyces canus TaxID=58343 RepID=UPI002256D397|nr:hypothetical protein [Streptomyces canus]MCX4860672.1 hypothetical protein [Streptomyces canus]WSW34143.1 hypothetical protein OG426_17445 [Streptomyces canus]